MNEQKVCIIGDGLAGLTAAIILSKENIKIDLYCGNKKKNKKVDNRTTAISESNYQYIKKKLSFREQNLFWICKKINLFYEDKKKIINFLNFEEKNRSLMHIFQNKKLKKKLDKIVSKTKKIKVIKKNIKDINNKEGSVAFEKKKIFYDLIILSTGGYSKFYNAIEKDRSIEKNYEELGLTSIIKHNTKIENVSQFFLKEGPLAILPFKKNAFSIVWSVSTKFFNINKKNIKIIVIEKLRDLLKTKELKNIANIQSFPINLSLKTKYFKKNVLILGDGLHAVHPMAGQGFNLVLRDIKKLADLISTTLKLGLLIKDSFVLKDFYNARKPENNLFGFSINLTNIFFKDKKYFSFIKRGILNNINRFSLIKKISQSVSDRGVLF
jgi:2-polyprenyl-6-methoxyphenol hydroxylase-like FAD-dependent oxidoreductase